MIPHTMTLAGVTFSTGSLLTSALMPTGGATAGGGVAGSLRPAPHSTPGTQVMTSLPPGGQPTPPGGNALYYPDATDAADDIHPSLVSLLTTRGRVGLPVVEDLDAERGVSRGWASPREVTLDAASHVTTALEELPLAAEAAGAGAAHPLWLISLLCFLVAVCAAIVVIWFARRRGPYRRLAVLKERGYDYIYKPHGVLDDEYENTFVGVSVPLLQDITVI